MNTPKEILHRYDIRPDKRLGQSFLIDLNTIGKIADFCGITPEDTVLEIGAGIGVLTGKIAQIAKRVIAVEIDFRLLDVLHDQFDGLSHVEIHAGDILKLNISAKSNECKEKLKIVGNIPYNISSPVIFHLLAHRKAVENFTLMLQKEVVERLISSPGCKTYGVPSVLLQMYADMERLFDVSASCFYPRPKVDSAILHGTFRDHPLFALNDEDFFSRLVKASFAQRRKMLINNLKKASFLNGMALSEIQWALDEAAIDGKRRGETLDLREFSHLSHILKYRLTNPR